jgi:hypothetical protein
MPQRSPPSCQTSHRLICRRRSTAHGDVNSNWNALQGLQPLSLRFLSPRGCHPGVRYRVSCGPVHRRLSSRGACSLIATATPPIEQDPGENGGSRVRRTLPSSPSPHLRLPVSHRPGCVQLEGGGGCLLTRTSAEPSGWRTSIEAAPMSGITPRKARNAGARSELASQLAVAPFFSRPVALAHD